MIQDLQDPKVTKVTQDLLGLEVQPGLLGLKVTKVIKVTQGSPDRRAHKDQ